MKVSELLESRYGDLDSFVEYLFNILQEHTAADNKMKIVDLKNFNYVSEVVAVINSVKFDKNFKQIITKLMTKIFGPSARFYKKPKSKEWDEGWRVGPYFILPKADRSLKYAGDILIISVKEQHQKFPKGRWE